MSLNPTQLDVFKAHILANPDQAVIDGVANNDMAPIRDHYNAVDVAFWVFVNSVTTDDARIAFDLTEMRASPLSDNDRWLVTDILLANGTFDPKEEENRNFLATIFAGGSYAATRNALLTIIVRNGTVLESVFATTATGPAGGDGSGNTQAAISESSQTTDVSEVRSALERP